MIGFLLPSLQVLYKFGVTKALYLPALVAILFVIYIVLVSKFEGKYSCALPL